MKLEYLKTLVCVFQTCLGSVFFPALFILSPSWKRGRIQGTLLGNSLLMCGTVVGKLVLRLCPAEPLMPIP